MFHHVMFFWGYLYLLCVFLKKSLFQFLYVYNRVGIKKFKCHFIKNANSQGKEGDMITYYICDAHLIKIIICLQEVQLFLVLKHKLQFAPLVLMGQTL